MLSVAINSLTRTCWVDPAGGSKEGKHGMSRSAIVCVGADSLERIFILDTFIERCATTVLEQKILQFQTKWKPWKFGIDTTGPQTLFYDTMRRRAIEEGVRVPWVPLSTHADKMFQIERGLEPYARAGRLFRPEEKDCKALKEEFNAFPHPHLNDGMDALANAIRLLPHSLPEHMRQMDREQLRRYLMRIGTNNEIIKERLDQYDAHHSAVNRV